MIELVIILLLTLVVVCCVVGGIIGYREERDGRSESPSAAGDTGRIGQCRFCKQDAGLFSREHKKCKFMHESALKRMRVACVTAATTGRGNDSLLSKLEDIASGGHVNQAEIRPIMIKAWGEAVDGVSADMILGRNEHRSLAAYKRFHRLRRRELDRFGLADKMHQVVLLRSLVNDGAIPEYDPTGPLQTTKPRAFFTLMKSEALLWVFPVAEYLTEVSERHYSAGSQGFSFRVADGVTWRVGKTRGHSYTTKHMRVVDSGIMGVSTKHIYWAGQRGFGNSKSFRIRLNRIVSVERISGGVALMRDAQSAKPEAFRGIDGPFAAALIMVAAAALDEGGFTASDRRLDDLVDDAGVAFTAGADSGEEFGAEFGEGSGGEG